MLRWVAVASTALYLASCSRESGVVRPTPAPQFAVADSTLVLLPPTIGDSIVAVRSLGDSLLAVVTRAPGGVIVVRPDGTRSLPAEHAPWRPSVAVSCTHGGLLIISSNSTSLFVVSPNAKLTAAGRIPPGIGEILGAQCDRPVDLIVLADGTQPDVNGPTLLRLGAALIRLAGATADTLAAFPGRELLVFGPGDRGTPPPFGVTVRFAAGAARLYMISSDESSITVFQTNGRPLSSIGVVAEPPSLSRTTVDSALGARFGQRLAVLSASARRDMVDALTRERHAPSWAGLVVDGDENIWVAANEPPDRDGDRVWTIYRPDGSRRGRVFLPWPFDVTEVGKDFVLGYLRDHRPRDAVRRYGLQLLGS